jgi:hypothetical protein
MLEGCRSSRLRKLVTPLCAEKEASGVVALAAADSSVLVLVEGRNEVTILTSKMEENCCKMEITQLLVLPGLQLPTSVVCGPTATAWVLGKGFEVDERWGHVACIQRGLSEGEFNLLQRSYYAGACFVSLYLMHP